MHLFDTSLNSEEVVEFVPLPPVSSPSDSEYQELPDRLHMLQVIDEQQLPLQPEHPYEVLLQGNSI